MHKNSYRFKSVTAISVAAVITTMVGCSSHGGHDASPSPSQGTQHTGNGKPPGPQEIEVSPGGVTTGVNVPAESTEDQYAQACRAAKEWMESQGGDPHSQVEPFLKNLQTSTETGPATFNSSWAKLSTAQQAAVIVAVRAAGDGGCG